MFQLCGYNNELSNIVNRLIEYQKIGIVAIHFRSTVLIVVVSVHADVLIIVLVIVRLVAVIALLLVVTLRLFVVVYIFVIVVVLVAELLLVILHLIIHIKVKAAAEILEVSLLAILQVFFELLEVLVEFVMHFDKLVYALVIDLADQVVLIQLFHRSALVLFVHFHSLDSIVLVNCRLEEVALFYQCKCVNIIQQLLQQTIEVLLLL